MALPTSSKEIALDFLRLAAAGQVNEAFAQYVHADFRHHNVHFAAGAKPLRQAMEANALLHPHKVFQVQHALAEGDLVAVHSRVRQTPEDYGVSVIHLLRIVDGKIAELWDLGQSLPPNSPNTDGLF